LSDIQGSNASFGDCQCGELGLVSNILQLSIHYCILVDGGLITDLEFERVTLIGSN